MQTSTATAVLETGLPQNIAKMPLPESQAGSEAQAWRVVFRPVGETGTGEARLIKQPSPVKAWAEPVDLGLTLLAGAGAPGEDSFDIVWLPTQASSGPLEERAQQWLAGDTNGAGQIVRATIRTVRVAWTPVRAVIHAPVDQFDDAFDAVLRFTRVKRAVDQLEQMLPEMWADLDADVPLSHGLRISDLSAQRRVNERTDRVTRMNSSMLRLQNALEQLDVTLASASKRLFAELVLQATLYDRLEMLEDPIEFGMDHYELVNSRLLELRNGLIEIWLEVGIIALLVVGVALQLTGHSPLL